MTRTLDRIAERSILAAKLRSIAHDGWQPDFPPARSVAMMTRAMALSDACWWLNGGDRQTARAALREATECRRMGATADQAVAA